MHTYKGKRALLVKSSQDEFFSRAGEFGRMDLLSSRPLLAKAFGAALRHYRKEVGLSQDELSQVAGIDHAYPSLLERGLRTPTIGIVLVLACALKITPVELWCAFLERLRASSPRRRLRAGSAAARPVQPPEGI